MDLNSIPPPIFEGSHFPSSTKRLELSQRDQAMKHMSYKVIDRLFLVVLVTAEPTDEEWTTYLEVVERHGIDRTMQLIATDGGVPTSTQRRYLNERLAGRNVPVAVITGNTAVRSIVTAMSWFNRKIRAFPPSGFRDAIAYLQIPASRTELIEREMAKLKAELEDGRRATA